MKFDPIVKKETGFMALGCLACTAVIMVAFLVLGKFDYTVALGCLIGYLLAIMNFFIMSVSLSRALDTGDEITAKLKMRHSYVMRSIFMLVVMAISVVVTFIHWVPVVASVFYPRIVILVRGLWQTFKNRRKPDEAEDSEAAVSTQTQYDDENEESDEFEKFVSGFAKGPVPDAKKPDNGDKEN